MAVVARTQETRSEKLVKVAIGPVIGLGIAAVFAGTIGHNLPNGKERGAMYEGIIRQQTSCLNERFPGINANVEFVKHLNDAPMAATSTLLDAAKNCLRDAKTQVLK